MCFGCKKSNLDVHVSPGKSWNNLSQGKICPRNCIGVVIRLSRPTSDRYLLLDSRISFMAHAIYFPLTCYSRFSGVLGSLDILTSLQESTRYYNYLQYLFTFELGKIILN